MKHQESQNDQNPNKYARLTNHGGPTCLLRHPPVYAFHQHRQLRRPQADLTLTGRGPHKTTLLKTLGEQTRPLSIPPNHLDLIPSAATEQKQMSRVRITRQNLPRLGCKSPLNPRRMSVTPAESQIFASANTGVMLQVLAQAQEQSPHQHPRSRSACAHSTT